MREHVNNGYSAQHQRPIISDRPGEGVSWLQRDACRHQVSKARHPGVNVLTRNTLVSVENTPGGENSRAVKISPRDVLKGRGDFSTKKVIAPGRKGPGELGLVFHAQTHHYALVVSVLLSIRNATSTWSTTTTSSINNESS